MSVLTREPSRDQIYNEDSVNNILREKEMSKNPYCEEQWLCNEISADFHPNNGEHHDLDRNKYDEFNRRGNPKRKFRTQSESECSDSRYNQPNKSCLKKEEYFEGTNTRRNVSHQRAKKLPPTPKKSVSLRVPIYNNSLSPKFTRHLTSHSPTRLTSAGEHTNKNQMASYRQSVSPSLSYVISDDSMAEYEVYMSTTKSTLITQNLTVENVSDKSKDRSTSEKTFSFSNLECQSEASSNEDDLDMCELELQDYGFDTSSVTSSDSDEDGYRSHAYKVCHSDDKLDVPLKTTATVPEVQVPYKVFTENIIKPESLLVPSLFPNVPPYLSFSSHSDVGPEIPEELYEILKWKATRIMPKIARRILANSHVQQIKKTSDWMGTWGKHIKSPCFKTIRPYQKFNHLPGSFKIGRKDACWINLQKQMFKFGKKEFGFMPKTYILPGDINLLRKNWPKYAQKNVKWIIKPPASARGAGIRVINRWAQIPKRKSVIVQKYIERPFLINGNKFDLRLYVLVTSINPLRVYLYKNGLVRFASVKYSSKSDTLNDRCMHLTNYSINKYSLNYTKNENVNACDGHKWTLHSLWDCLEKRGVRTERLWDALKNLVMRTLLAGEHAMNSMIKLYVESKYSCFELFGFDVLLDEELVPWLLEVNISPSLHSELPLDVHVKAPLLQGVLNTVLYNVPPKLAPEKQKELAEKMGVDMESICFDKRIYVNYLSRAERIKHNQFTRKTLEDRDDYINSILQHLTPDDVRCLLVAEDELARSAPLERIFPAYGAHKFLKFTENPRYYNRLLDAWENRYSKNRQDGIKLLREYCEKKYHLEVSQPPVRKQIKRRTRTMKKTSHSTLALMRLTRAIKRMNRKSLTKPLTTNTNLQENGHESETGIEEDQ